MPTKCWRNTGRDQLAPAHLASDLAADRGTALRAAAQRVYLLGLRPGGELVELHPNTPAYRANYALYAMYASDFPRAKEEASALLETTPGYYTGYVPLAIAELAADNHAAAVAVYERMAELIADPFTGQQFATWPPDDAVLSSAGLGPIRIGMLVSELEAELGTDLTVETIDDIRNACGWIATTTAIAREVFIIVEATGGGEGIVRRVSTVGGPWFTPSGITVSSSQQDVIETFPGQIEERPHVYTDGTYMRFLPNDADDPNTVEFVNEGGRIAEIRAGDRDWVGLIEGCA